LFTLIAFNFERITGSTIRTPTTTISLSEDGENFLINPVGNEIMISAGDMLYVKLSPSRNNKRVFVYDPRHSSKAGTFETKCFERSGTRCVSSLAVYKTPVDQWTEGVYTIKVAGVSGKAEFTLENSNYQR
jgi:hypothetical protein